MSKNLKNSRGQILIQTLLLSALAVVFIGVLVNLANFNLASSTRSFNSELAFQISEAGIEYYRWHLAHAPQDFQDGTGGPGPYTHDFRDKDGTIVGQFILTITPPPIGSTVVTILSEGRVNVDQTARRKIKAQLAVPSIAKYATVANDKMRFGQGTEVFGPIHSNDGVRFDGLAHNIVTSAKSTYNDPDHDDIDFPRHSYHADVKLEFGVHTHKDPSPGSGINNNFRPQEGPPTDPIPNRSDVFLAGRQVSVPAVDFIGLTADLADIKSEANTPSGRYFAPSGALGYEMVLKPNGTFDIYKVTSKVNPPQDCTNTLNQSSWDMWSVSATSSTGLSNPYTFPSNGLIFVEDHLWISGQINNARLTIASGRFPESQDTDTNITVNNDLLYTNYDGADVIGLIAQKNFNVGWISENDLRIDAALIAKNGRAGRHYYKPPSDKQYCAPHHVKNAITLYGMIATNQRYGFAYTDGTGYQTRNIIYDPNLLYGPPPSFPLTSDQYQTISWEEVK